MKKGLKALAESFISTMFIIGIFLFATAFIDWLGASIETNLKIYAAISVVSGAAIIYTNRN